MFSQWLLSSGASPLRLRSTPLLSLSSLPFIHIDTPDLSLFPLVRAAVGEVKAQFEAVFRIVRRSKVVPFFRGARQGRAFN